MRQITLFYLGFLVSLLGLQACQSTQELAPMQPVSVSVATEKTIELPSDAWWQHAWQLYRQGNFSRALVVAQKLKKDHWGNNLLGTIYRQLHHLDKAEAAYRQALQQRIRVYGAQHPQVSAVYNNLGNLAQSRKDYPRARQWYALGLNIPQIATDQATLYNNIGKTYFAEEKYGLAREYFEQASEKYNAENQYIALTNLGELYRETGEYDRSERYFYQALAACPSMFGEPTYQVAGIYNQLCYLYYLEEKFDQMQKYVHIAYSITHDHNDIKTYTRVFYEYVHTQGDAIEKTAPQELGPPEGEPQERNP